MGIYIKGMKMPANCSDCSCCYDMMACSITGNRMDFENMDDERLGDCPLTEVPEPHGRLIDVDALKEKINTTFWSEIGAIIDNAPTIIERSEG